MTISTRSKLLLIAAAAFLLRVHGVRSFPLDLDEMLQYYVACKPASLAGLLVLLRGMPLHAVLDPLIHWGFARISRELWWLRLAPVLLGTACVPALFALARRFGESTALWACALLAVSVAQVELSGFVDFYPLLVLCALATAALLMSAAESGRGRAFAAYGAAMAVFLYSHPWGVLAAGLHAVWIAACRRERLRPFLLALLGAGALFLPWAVCAYVLPSSGPRWFNFTDHPLLPQLLSTFMTWTGKPEREGLYEMARLHAWAAASAPLYAALAAYGIVRLRRDGRWNADWTFVAIMAVGGPAAVLTADRLFSYLYAPRQALFAAPFFLLFAAEGLRALDGRVRRFAALLLAVLALGAHLELSRQQSLRSAHNDVMVARVRAAEPGRPLLFDEPNFAAFILFHIDRDAFLRLESPALHGNFYVFGWPENPSAAGHPLEVVWNPEDTPEREAARWRAMDGEISSRELPTKNILFGLMREEPKRKIAEWMRALGPTLAAAPD